MVGTEPSSFRARRPMPLALAAAASMATGAAACSAAGGEGCAHLAWIGAPVAVVLASTAWARSARRAWACFAGALVGAALMAERTEPAAKERCRDGPVEIVGTVATAPRLVGPGADALSTFLARDAARSFGMEVDGTMSSSGLVSASGRVTVRVAGLARLPGRGSSIRVRGWMRWRTPPLNPGGEQRGPWPVVEVPYAWMVEDTAPQGFRAWVVRVRACANAALERSMPRWSREEDRALVVAMTTGIRLPGLESRARSFRDAGISHVLAISGFNVGVLVAAVAGMARAAGAAPPVRAGLAVAVACAFLAITEPETSVLRAGIGAGLAGACSLRGGRARALGVLGCTAIASMLLDVGCIMGAGFQLSYGVVAALLLLAPTATDRWCTRLGSAKGPGADTDAVGRGGEVARIVTRWTVGAIVASTVAWSVSAPIAAAHGGGMAMLAVPLSVVTMPVAALTTVAGVSCIASADAVPAAGHLLAGIAACGASSLAWAAEAAAMVPCGSLPVMEGAWWSGLAAVPAAYAWVAPRRASRTACWCLVAGTMTAASWFPSAGAAADADLEVVELAVAQGGCSIARAGGTAVVVDPGSRGSPDLGSSTVIPALRSLGIGRIDAVVLTSASVGAWSAVPEIVAALRVGCVLVEEGALARMRESRDGQGAALLGTIARSGTPVQGLPELGGARIGGINITLARATHRGRVRDAVVASIEVDRTDGSAARWAASGAGKAGAATRTIFGRSGAASVQRWDGGSWVPVDP